jgi:hypothetical protein
MTIRCVQNYANKKEPIERTRESTLLTGPSLEMMHANDTNGHMVNPVFGCGHSQYVAAKLSSFTKA